MHAINFLLLGMPSALAHMQLHHPPPFNSSNNPHRTTPADPYLDFPFDCCGESSRWTQPCHGYLPLLSTDEGAPTATWSAGSKQRFSLEGSSNHYGGSCQAGFSTDGGETFRVATTWEGNCPLRDGGVDPESQTFEFDVPADLKAGNQVFAWVWVNREQEVFMSCAPVEITGGSETTSSIESTANRGATGDSSDQGRDTTSNRNSAAEKQRRRKQTQKRDVSGTNAVSWADRPLMFFPFTSSPSGMDPGCELPLTTAELKFPDSGPVVVAGDGVYPLEECK